MDQGPGVALPAFRLQFSKLQMLYKLAYFPVRGRGMRIRYMCVDNDLPLEVEDVDENTWPAFKVTTPLGQLPVFRDGDFELSQTGAIIRYLARKHDLYGSNDQEKALIDMIHNQQEDIREGYIRLIYKEYDTCKESYIKSLPEILAPLEKMLTRNNDGKGFFVGNKISFADYSMFDILDNLIVLSPGSLDAFPNLKAFHDRIAARPNLATYRQSEEFRNLPRNGNGKE